ncbi:MAG: diguanylate cyclase [Acidimicrobiia bacterium]
MRQQWRVPRLAALGGSLIVVAVAVVGAVALLRVTATGGWAVAQAWVTVTILTGTLVASEALARRDRTLSGWLSSFGVLAIWVAGVFSLVDAVGGRLPGFDGLVQLSGAGFLVGAGALAAGLALRTGEERRRREAEPVEQPSKAVDEPEEPLVMALRSALKEARLSDPLTGLTTLYGLEEQGVATAYEQGVVVIFNLDDLGWINRRFGRKAGDDIMRQAAEALSSALFGRAALARLGGDEFLAMVTGGQSEGALVANRGRAAVKAMALARGGMEEMTLSVSVGMAEVREQRISAFSEALSMAETALDEALLRGGDRIVWAAREGAPEEFPEVEVDERAFSG